mgnify:CR=1 FL=1
MKTSFPLTLFFPSVNSCTYLYIFRKNNLFVVCQEISEKNIMEEYDVTYFKINSLLPSQ